MGTKIKIYNQNGENTGEMELADKVFSVKPNVALVHQAFVTQQANERQVLAHTKDRSEVSGGGKKPWRQKGTGRARAGSSRSPIWIGGGVTFGPTKDRNFKKDINKKMKQKALTIVLSDRANNNDLILIDKLELAEFKTKAMSEILKKLEKARLGAAATDTKTEEKPSASKKKNVPKEKTEKAAKRSLLFINDAQADKAKFSARNLSGVKVLNLDNLNIVDLLSHKQLLLTIDSAKKLEERYGQAGTDAKKS